MQRSIKSKIVSVILIFSLVLTFTFSSPVKVFANAADDYAAAQEALDKINKEIADLEDKEEQQQAEKDNAQNQADLIKGQINTLIGQIEQTGIDLANKQHELEVKKEDINYTDELFQERLKAMYMMGDNAQLSTVFGVDSFSESLIAADTLSRISVADTDLLIKLTEEKLIIETEEAAIQVALDELESQQATLETKVTELASVMQVLDAELSQTDALQQAASETQAVLYQQYVAAKEALEAEFENGSGAEFVGGDWLWPVPNYGHISSHFGWRTIYGQPDNHIGIDIAKGTASTIQGATIVASNSGVVKTAIWNPSYGYGNYVIIDHGGNNFTLYGHCNTLLVGVGDTVAKGQAIATVGTTGNSTGPHLHFEIRLNSVAVDPLPYVQGTRP